MSEDEQDIQWSELARAYEERSVQLYEARGALAEAVATLTTELNRCREERDRALADVAGLREHVTALEGEIEKGQREFERLNEYAAEVGAQARDAQQQLAALHGITVVSWIARSRTLARRLRDYLR